MGYAPPPNTFVPPPPPPEAISQQSSGIHLPDLPNREVTDQEPAGFAPERSQPSHPDSSISQVYQAPGPEPNPQQDHPRLIALKNGSAYTIMEYWVKEKTLHFITTQGDHIEVPLVQVERLYPRTKEDLNLAAKLPAVHR